MFWCLNFIPFHFYTIADTSNGCVQRYVSITSCLFHFENIFLLLLLRLLLLFNVRWNELRIHLTATVVVVVVLVVVFVIFIKLALFMCSRHKSSVCVCVDIPLSSYASRDFASFCFALDFIKSLAFLLLILPIFSSPFFFFFFCFCLTNFKFRLSVLRLLCFFSLRLFQWVPLSYLPIHSKVAHHFTPIRYTYICINHKNVLTLIYCKTKIKRVMECGASNHFYFNMGFSPLFSLLVGSQALWAVKRFTPPPIIP